MEACAATQHYGLGLWPDCECETWYQVDPLPVRVPAPHTAVYLFFGWMPWERGEVASSSLLYVGVSDNPRSRWEAHRREKAWWPDVEWAQVRLCSSREDALQHEAELIEALDPPHNRTGSHHLLREDWRFRNRERLPRSVRGIAERWTMPA